jgi:diaminohydroxyphosphoribosylaminopyrimidine deaminase/5-amino-6-(5-phosphoribosylamino)uracil reductase
MRDPNPEVAGQGIQILRDAGIQAIGPIDPVRCKRFNRGFVSLHEQQRPWITIKQAQTRDGRIANKDLSAEALAKAGSLPLKITSEKQDAWSHEYLRAKHDAILVGVETIVRDDPQLTVRLKPVDRSAGRESSNKKSVQVDPLRIVLDPNCRVPLDAQIIGEGTCIVTAESADVPSGLEERGATVIKVPFDGKTLDFTALWSVLITPKDNFYGITSILVEGGPKTWETFRKANIVDEEVVLVG